MTKGIDELKKEMFNVNEPLVDENSECNQELVNLFLTGRAVSGVIDGENFIEELVYRGEIRVARASSRGAAANSLGNG